MAQEYLKVFAALEQPVELVGRGEAAVSELEARFGVPGRSGGVGRMDDLSRYSAAIVATGVTDLAETAEAVLVRGCRHVLVEKPGALFLPELLRLQQTAATTASEVSVAYNRRFYPSVDAARNAISEDGGLLSMTFDFTELEGRARAAHGGRPDFDVILRRLGVVNSLHVIDLFLHLGGLPSSWEHHVSGSLDWHPSGAIFSGSGVTDRGIWFSYLSTWSGAGRWGLELTTRNRKLILRPLEQLVWQRRDSFELESVRLAEEPPGLKVGLGAQVAAFLHQAAGAEPDPRLSTLAEAIRHFEVAEVILGYS